jgi:hypothetical protein
MYIMSYIYKCRSSVYIITPVRAIAIAKQSSTHSLVYFALPIDPAHVTRLKLNAIYKLLTMLFFPSNFSSSFHRSCRFVIPKHQLAKMCYNNIKHSCGHTVKSYSASCACETNKGDLTASIRCCSGG